MTIRHGVIALGIVLAGCAGEPSPPGGGAETRVLVVSTQTSDVSGRVAAAYVDVRHVAASHRVVLDVPVGDSLTRDEFNARVRDPLVSWWRDVDASRTPMYVVLTAGVPLRIVGGTGRDGDEASVDSELTALPAWAAGEDIHLPGPIPNPLFGGRADDAELARELTLKRVCLVTRLDGFTEADAMALIERPSRASPPTGAVLVDHDGRRGQRDGTRSLRRLADLSLPVPVVYDSSAEFICPDVDLIAYAGWGSNDTQFRRGAPFRWLPGAVVATFVSTSARTVAEPPATWRPGRARETELEFHGTTQSLAADWIRSGATGVIGYAGEPWLDGCARPDIFIDRYLEGRTLADAAYRSLPYLSWRSVVFGDPLARLPPP